MRSFLSKYFFEQVLIFFNPIFGFEFSFVSFQFDKIICDFISDSFMIRRPYSTVDSYVSFDFLKQVVFFFFLFINLFGFLLQSENLFTDLFWLFLSFFEKFFCFIFNHCWELKINRHFKSKKVDFSRLIIVFEFFDMEKLSCNEVLIEFDFLLMMNIFLFLL